MCCKGLKLALEFLNRWPPQKSCFENLSLRYTSSEEMPNIYSGGWENIFMYIKNKHNVATSANLSARYSLPSYPLMNKAI